jgi:putative tryptophan/tyrosine transport system substrate-binding protein
MRQESRPVRRRQLLLTAAASATAASAGVLWPTPAAQAQTARTIRLAWAGSAAPAAQTYNQAFLARLAELGYAEGRNLLVDFNNTTGRGQELAQVGKELAGREPDVYFAPGAEANLIAVKSSSKGKPIVIVANDYDPVATGHVASLARPGGRITGLSQLQLELPAKRLEVLKEFVPRMRRVAVLADSSTQGQLRVSHDAAARLKLELVVHEFGREPYDFAAAFAAFAQARCEALVALTSGFFVPKREYIATQALAQRMPSVFNNSVWAEVGGLVSYGPDFAASYRRAAEILARILAGANPAEMPVEQPNAVEMVLNMKTAHALGISVPQSIRLRAARLIE